MRQRLQQWGRVSVRIISGAALLTLMALEGFSSTPYLDVGGNWTDGYGNTDGVTATTPPVSKEQAKQDLERGVQRRTQALDRCLRVTPTQNQYDALALWAYNVGPTAACSSTLMRQLNAGALPSVWCAQLLRWDKVRVNGQLVVSKGLHNRRETEYQLCMKP
jgi:lysozyme